MEPALMITTDIRGEVRADEPMSRHCSWRAGGRADRFVKPADIEDLKTMLRSLDEDEPCMWIGLGSNTLFRDGGYRGTVITVQGVLNRMEMLSDDTVYVGAGMPDAKLARFCKRHDLFGAEWFAGIPGLIGGALAMNAGAWGGETWEHVISVDTIDRNGDIRTRAADEYEVGYRSVNGPEGEWFIGSTMRFETDMDPADVIDIKTLLEKRAASQPTGTANGGSVFRNPEGDHAARLIESCGLKGTRIGGAVISEKHANFIINDRAASASDIEALIELARERVKQQHGVDLHREVKLVGDAL